MKLPRCNAPDGQIFRAGQATLFCLLPPHDAKTPHQFAETCGHCGATIDATSKPTARVGVYQPVPFVGSLPIETKAS